MFLVFFPCHDHLGVPVQHWLAAKNTSCCLSKGWCIKIMLLRRMLFQRINNSNSKWMLFIQITGCNNVFIHRSKESVLGTWWFLWWLSLNSGGWRRRRVTQDHPLTIRTKQLRKRTVPRNSHGYVDSMTTCPKTKQVRLCKKPSTFQKKTDIVLDQFLGHGGVCILSQLVNSTSPWFLIWEWLYLHVTRILRGWGLGYDFSKISAYTQCINGWRGIASMVGGLRESLESGLWWALPYQERERESPFVCAFTGEFNNIVNKVTKPLKPLAFCRFILVLFHIDFRPWKLDSSFKFARLSRDS